MRRCFSKEEGTFPSIDEINRTRKKYNRRMSQSGVKTFREIGELEANALKDGALGQKYEELIAVFGNGPRRLI